MCGIFGYINHNGPVPEAAEAAFLDVQRHRGPDDSGVYREPGVLMGMNRLAVIDLDTGHQPIPNEDRSLWICFNGEIYNYPDLRAELIQKGHEFGTRTDTEVVLHAFEEYGPDCLNRLNGMFAFVIWNARDKVCFIARDRLGIKPLYYYNKNGRFCFASELKTMLAVVPDRGGLDRLALSRYFSFGYVPTPQSPFKDIRKLSPGHWLIYQDGALSGSRWWNISLGQSENSAGMSMDKAVADVSDALLAAVKMELMSDVPLGCFLSGGVDSSAVTALACKCLDTPVKTFCFKFAESTHDESADARIVAEHLGTDHHEIYISPKDMIAGLETITDSLDEPFADSTYLTLYILSREVRKHVTVALTGMGGDEVFTGYPTIKAHRWMNRFAALPGFLRKGLIPALVNRLPASDKYFSFEFKAKRFVRGQDLPRELQHFVWMENFLLDQKYALLGDFAPEGGVYETYANVTDELSRCDANNLLNRVLYLDMKYFLENNGLFQVDRSSMAHSLEARVPLLNTAVLDTVFRIPFGMKCHRGNLKHLLKQSVRHLLPERVFKKPKKGFGPPVSAWLRTIMKDFARDVLSPENLHDSPVNPACVDRMIKEHLDKTADHGRALWAVLIFQMWWNKYA